MSENYVPEKPKNSFRVILELRHKSARLDQILLEELRKQKENLDLQNISRTAYKELFKKKKIRIKGQPATPTSSLAAGISYIDILGYGEPEKAE